MILNPIKIMTLHIAGFSLVRKVLTGSERQVYDPTTNQNEDMKMISRKFAGLALTAFLMTPTISFAKSDEMCVAQSEMAVAVQTARQMGVTKQMLLDAVEPENIRYVNEAFVMPEGQTMEQTENAIAIAGQVEYDRCKRGEI